MLLFGFVSIVEAEQGHLHICLCRIGQKLGIHGADLVGFAGDGVLQVLFGGFDRKFRAHLTDGYAHLF